MYCRNCYEVLENHASGGKCLFHSTYFEKPRPGDKRSVRLMIFASHNMSPHEVWTRAVNLIAAKHPNGVAGAEALVQSQHSSFARHLAMGDTLEIVLDLVMQ